MTGNVISDQYAVLKPGSGGMNIYQKGLEIFWKPSSIYVL